MFRRILTPVQASCCYRVQLTGSGHCVTCTPWPLHTALLLQELHIDRRKGPLYIASDVADVADLNPICVPVLRRVRGSFCTSTRRTATRCRCAMASPRWRACCSKETRDASRRAVRLLSLICNCRLLRYVCHGRRDAVHGRRGQAYSLNLGFLRCLPVQTTIRTQ